MSVKRYRVDYKHGIVEDDGSHDYWPATTSAPMVLATDFDAIASRLEEAVNLLKAIKPALHTEYFDEDIDAITLKARP